ncbi:MAG: UDP-2,3-diacylglucosamine diphosphatase [Flavobacteriales bacterium]|nr:UDP-2,3-diacylglucosamine diphosphatase [Flavobacteriales bacterium]
MKKYFFASDFHLGAPSYEESLIREKRIVQWLEEIRHEAEEIFIVGDVFDFWFEYKTVIPRGFVRLLGKLAEITDSGTKIHWFIGNHDMWIFDYIPKEIGVEIHREPITRELNGKKFYIGHGDGLGPGDHGYKLLKNIFRSKLCQWIFARLHPNFGIWLANSSSKYSRKKGAESDKVFLGAENEWLAIYSNEISQTEQFDYFIFGHRHLPMIIDLKNGGKYINLGDWISHFTYASYDDDVVLQGYGTQTKIYSNKQ